MTTFKTIQDALEHIVGEHGKDILLDSKRLHPALKETLIDNQEDFKTLGAAFRLGIPQKMAGTTSGKTDDERRKLMALCVNRLLENYSADRITVGRVLTAYAKALGWPAPQRSAAPPTSTKPDARKAAPPVAAQKNSADAPSPTTAKATAVSFTAAGERRPDAANVRGNTPSNLANGGWVAAQGDWVYFVTGHSVYSNIYKARHNGSDAQCLLHDYIHGPSSLNVVGDWVYYRRLDGEYDSKSKLYKIRVDGKGRKKLSYDSVSSFVASNDWIYYRGYEGKNMKIRPDGKQKQKFDLGTDSIDIDGDVLYCQLTRLLPGRRGDTVYGTLYGDKVADFNIAGKWVYYSNQSDNGSLYKIRTDGSGKQKLDELKSITTYSHRNYPDKEGYASVTNICIAGDWVYYRINEGVVRSASPNQLRVRADGSGAREVVCKNGFIPMTAPAITITDGTFNCGGIRR